MPRLHRLPSISHRWYFVVLTARRARQLVDDDEDIARLLAVLRSTLREYGAHLHAGRVTPSEAWFALQAGKRPITAATGAFCHRYARRFNDRHQSSGALFKPHSHVLLFQHERWLIRLMHYIHGSRHELEHEKCWWTTERVYAEHRRVIGVTTYVIFRLLSNGNRDRCVQDQAYGESAKEPHNPQHANLFLHGSPEDPRLLGDTAFVADVWQRTRQNSPHSQPLRDEATFNRIRAAVATVLSRFKAKCKETLSIHRAREWERLATLESVCSKSRKVPLPLVRLIIATHVIGCGIATRAQLARFFNCHPTSLSLKRRKWCEAKYPEWFVHRDVPAKEVDSDAPSFETQE
jgi:hypothetical protein